MPLGGLLPYDDDEEELRRRKPIMLTPPRDPNAPPELPEPTPRPRMLPPPSPEIPGGAMPSPPLAGPRGRGAEVAEARDVYMQGTPGRGKSALTGFLQGLGRGGIGGGIAGAATGAISPRTVRRQQFRQEIQPQIAERFAFEDQERARQRQAEQDALNDEFKRAQIGATNRSNLPRPLPPPRPMSTPRGALNVETNTIIPGTEPLPTPPRELAPRPVLNERGEYEDFNAATKAGRKIKAFQKPKATGGGGKAKAGKKVADMDMIRKYMKDTGSSRSKAIADAIRDGYQVVR